jgi:glycerol kinase
MNNMGFITHSEKISELAATVEDNGGCVFVTAFSGLFAPYWIDDAKVRLACLGQHHYITLCKANVNDREPFSASLSTLKEVRGYDMRHPSIY